MSKHKLNKRFYILFFPTAIAILILLMEGCGSSESTKRLRAEEYFHMGMEKFRDENYLDAIEDFKVVSLEYQGSRVADSAQYYMAESRFNREEYILAAFEYDLLIRNMPSSVFLPRARFKRATCYYNLSPKSYLDQIDTRKAIDEYQEFLEYHPSDTLAKLASERISELNTKLAKKDFENGMTYMHMEYYKAACYYFDQVLEKYFDTPYAEPALLKKAEALVSRKRYREAKEAIDKFVSKYPQSEQREEAVKLGAEAESKISEEVEKNKKVQMKKDAGEHVSQSGS